MILILLTWVGLWVTLPIAGLLVQRAVDKQDTNLDFFENIWMGYAGLTGVLQLMSFLLPMKSELVLLIWSVIILLGFVLIPKTDIVASGPKIFSKLTSKWKYGLAAIIILAIGIFSSAQQVKWYDTYLYHFNMVAWNRNYPVTPGLANLQERLGFNSSFLLVASFVERFTQPGYSAFILNGFLLVTLILQFLKIILMKSENSFIKIFAVLMLPFLLLKLTGLEIPSLSTDLPVAVFSLAFLISLLQKQRSLLYTSTMALLLPTIKLSAIAAPLILFLYLLVLRKIDFKTMAVKSLVGLVILLGFLGRNVILSGFPFFPSTILGINAEWQVPQSIVKAMAEGITAWARMPGPDYLKTLDHGLFYWLVPWYKNFRTTLEMKLLLAALIAVLFFGRSLFIRTDHKYPLLFAYSFASILWLFVMAPDLRFGGVYFWILGTGTLAAILSRNIPDPRNQFQACGYLVFVIIALLVVPQFSMVYLKQELSSFSFQPFSFQITDFPLVESQLRDGTKIWRPTSGDLCGNTNLLCTPNQPNIQLIDSSNLAKGFRHN